MIKQQWEKHQEMFIVENKSNLTTAISGDASVSSGNTRVEPSTSLYTHHHQQQQQYFNHQQDEQLQQPPTKKRRNLPGNPDPEAEVIALSPKTLMATNRFVCEICNKGFQRDQNLQLHRRGHNLPWKLKQRTNKEVVRKKVYVCPEVSCVHHDPARALGDLTGIKKHFSRKHGEKKWKCEKCSKRYAVQSDWKAHSKVCGTREYRCDCGTLFSRRDSFITHRAFCDALAEETARAITTNNSLLSNPISATLGSSSPAHLINLEQQAQFLNNHQQQHADDPLHAFPLKRAQHHQQNLINNNLPPWLDPRHHHHQLSSSNFHHNNHDQIIQHQNANPNSNNNNNASVGPTISSGGLGGPYHTQAAAAASPHMSATALLQKAAQMGATMSNTATPPPHHHHNHHYHSHVSDTSSNTTTTTPAGLFPLNLSSSRDQQHPHQQQVIIPTLTNPNPNPNQNPNTGPNPSSFLQDMMINNTLPSSYDHHLDDAFGMGSCMSNMMSTSTTSNKGSAGAGDGGGGRGGAGNEGLTRDFLGLRPLPQSDILTIAGLRNCMNTNTTTTFDHYHQEGSHKSWQG